MFLSKKNAKYFNKPKNPEKPKRALAGWDDQPYKEQNYTVDYKLPAANSFQVQGVEAVNEPPREKFYFNWDELDERADIECEKKIIEEIVQLGGIRIKPSDSMLNDFDKEVKGMDVAIIGSLLLSKLEVNYPFQVKAKALYTIEYMVKRHKNYLSYFDAHREKLIDFPQPEDNVDNYKKILKALLTFIGVEQARNIQQEPQIVFVDPGYNEEPIISQKEESKKNNVTKQIKKPMIGPNKNKDKNQLIQSNNILDANFDLMGMDFTQKNKTAQKQPSLLTFEDLLGNISKPKQNEFHL